MGANEWDADNQPTCKGTFEDCLRKTGPTRRPCRSAMIKPADTFFLHKRQEGDNGIGKIVCRCRRTALVINDAELVALDRKAQHGPNEIVAIGAVDPGRAQNRDLGAAGNNGPLARQFAQRHRR